MWPVLQLWRFKRELYRFDCAIAAVVSSYIIIAIIKTKNRTNSVYLQRCWSNLSNGRCNCGRKMEPSSITAKIARENLKIQNVSCRTARAVRADCIRVFMSMSFSIPILANLVLECWIFILLNKKYFYLAFQAL